MFKQIRPVRLPTTCADCRFNNDDRLPGGLLRRAPLPRPPRRIPGRSLHPTHGPVHASRRVHSERALRREFSGCETRSTADSRLVTRLRSTPTDRGSQPAMPTEYEAKVLDIDPAEIARTILEGRPQHRRARAAPLRLRHRSWRHDQVDPAARHRRRATLTVKEIAHDGIDGTHEVEVTVSDFEATNELLGLLGFTRSRTRRTAAPATLDGAQLEIDEWPMIPPYLEIEADSRERGRRRRSEARLRRRRPDRREHDQGLRPLRHRPHHDRATPLRMKAANSRPVHGATCYDVPVVGSALRGSSPTPVQRGSSSTVAGCAGIPLATRSQVVARYPAGSSRGVRGIPRAAESRWSPTVRTVLGLLNLFPGPARPVSVDSTFGGSESAVGFGALVLRRDVVAAW